MNLFGLWRQNCSVFVSWTRPSALSRDSRGKCISPAPHFLLCAGLSFPAGCVLAARFAGCGRGPSLHCVHIRCAAPAALFLPGGNAVSFHIPGIMRNYKSYCGIFTRSSIRIKGLHFIFFSSGLRISSEKYPSERFYPALTTLSSDAKLHGSSSGSISWTGCAGNFPAVKSSMVRKTRSAISSTGWRSET